MNSSPRPQLAVLTNFIPPTRLPVFHYIAARTPTVFLLDALSEDNRHWRVNHGSLNVKVQRGISIPVHYRHPAGFRERSFLHLPFGLLWSLLRLRPKFVLSGELGLRTGIAALYRLCNPNCRLAVWVEGTLHTDAPRGTLRRLWRRLLLRFPDRVLATSSGARDLVCALGLPESKACVAFSASGFGPPPQPPQRDSAQRGRLLYVGRFVARKGLRSFLEALAAVCADFPARKVEFWFVGYGEEENWLRSFSSPPNLSLRILPPVELDQMPAIYSQCGILVFPTLADVWGLVTNEAMAYSMPVLGSTYAQSVCDLVQDGVNGWTFSPANPDAMRDAIRRALSSDCATLEKMGQAARQTAFLATPEKFAQALLDAALGAGPASGADLASSSGLASETPR